MRSFTLVLALVLCSFAALSQKTSAPRINHIALYTQNLEKSTRFYRDLLGLDTIPEPFHDGKHTWFTIGSGGAALHLIEGLGAPVDQNKNTHLCFSVPQLQPLISKLSAAGVPYEDWPGKSSSITTRIDGVHQIYFKDLDGHWLEVNDEQK
ncbi:lactoylglutathione lyase [Cnuella takakiae]|uniref:Lactoylglutathione lyase n=1 Tax=Cnuella takakiae TaxID=1302690 RepID=A0A1M4XQM0_9BACT|nr:VOC family protein [Cnuella takakiae]OLY92910.1 glyoxalase [Cnuella takakiae]SHE95755.1 lactoylglutathione lyase [Cnuella takakiae]